MWVFYLAFLAMTGYLLWQIPPQWRGNKWIDYPILAVVFLGFSSLIILISCFYRLPNGWFRQAVLYTETVFFCLLAFAAAVCLFRQLAYYPLRHFGGKRIVRLFADRRLFMIIVLLCTTVFCAVGFGKMDRLEVTRYDVTIPKQCDDSLLRIALMADIHAGTGASYAQMERMTEAVNAMDADLVILSGDIVDSSTSEEDLEHLCNSFRQMESRYGIYYAEGNHEEQCHYPLLPGLEAAGVKCLFDSAEILPNGLAVIGRRDSRKVSVEEICRQYGITETMTTIVIQHRPQQLQQMQASADLVLSGHTHGYQYPMCALFFPAVFQPIDGIHQFGGMQAVTTAGVAAWGYHCTWPAGCEIALIELHLEGGNAQ